MMAFPDRVEHIEFRNVGFHYDTGPQVLNDIDLHVEPGQTIALVGATAGGGKSTLVNLAVSILRTDQWRDLP